MENSKEEIKNAVEVLRKGGIILYPTDTIWGIGCDATNETAVQKILDIKGRVSDKGLIVLLDVAGRLETYVKEVPNNAWDLIEFSEKPLTIIYDHAQRLAESVKASDGSIGIRVTKDDFCKKLVEQLKKPIVSTSANLSGRPFPNCYDDIEPEVLNGVDYIVNLRRKEKMSTPPSNVVRLKNDGQIIFLR
ncbi:MAG: hypothetical protein RIT43_203 [Bacteroidota bacterium]|jgi:L-threonylcarbamoyladenylate synthase